MAEREGGAVGHGLTAWCLVTNAHQARAQPKRTAQAPTQGAADADSLHKADKALQCSRPLRRAAGSSQSASLARHRGSAHVRLLAGLEAARPRPAPPRAPRRPPPASPPPLQRPPPRPPLQPPLPPVRVSRASLHASSPNACLRDDVGPVRTLVSSSAEAGASAQLRVPCLGVKESYHFVGWCGGPEPALMSWIVQTVATHQRRARSSRTSPTPPRALRPRPPRPPARAAAASAAAATPPTADAAPASRCRYAPAAAASAGRPATNCCTTSVTPARPPRGALLRAGKHRRGWAQPRGTGAAVASADARVISCSAVHPSMQQGCGIG